ncbi:MerC domain-containing protein [Cesiribacter andamanensis]|uniref:MerC mercury resistance protein n=1 Tax=Cesiribacter andamanensis AMV16 TaxID=1279009 RepID=M7N4C3_9BACT|nr:MerC domain-containing protein [Cesiribacter andamanensis]EMR03523.1 MerC mercury resistance protein [Cesiribacter andamanensis AMV16]
MRDRFFSLHLDSAGFFASIVCALHCAFLPLLLLALPHASLPLLHTPAAEFLMIGASFGLSLAALSSGFGKHKRKRVLLAMLAGFSIILLGITTALPQGAEILATSSGALLVSLGHYLNWYYTHRK